jgi:indolepyruvate ferredoxin oxidoreductase beta subunit
MSYEDVIRVADLKTRPERLAGIRAEVGAQDDEPLRITEFLKPGVDEIAAILPPALARLLHRWGGNRQWSMRVKTHTVSGYLQLRLLAKLRRWRPRSVRFQVEQQLIERWLEAICQACPSSPELAQEIALCANLNKGYGETFERGRGNFLQLLSTLIEPALEQSDFTASERIKAAREAALDTPASQVQPQTINWYPAGSNKSP